MKRLFINTAANTPTPQDYPNFWVEVTEYTKGLQDIKMTFSRKDDVVSRSISSQLSFYGQAYDLIYQELITNEGDFLYCKLEIDGFSYVFPFLQIKWNSLEWCTDKCEIKSNLTTWSEDLDKYRLLKNTLIWDEEFNNRDNHPFVHVRVSTFSGAKKTKYGIPGVYLREYLLNGTTKCGLTLDSSIFSYANLNDWTGDDYNVTKYVFLGILGDYQPRNPYYYAAVVQNLSTGSAGFEVGQNKRFGISEESNVLNKNMQQYLSDLSKIFNARYRIKNGILKLERKDYFYGTSDMWQDLSGYKMCLKLKQQDNWAYLRLELARDYTTNAPQDITQVVYPCSSSVQVVQGESPLPYQEIVEWNNPVSVRQEGELTRVFDEYTTNAGAFLTAPNSTPSTILNFDSYTTELPHLVVLTEDSAINRKTLFRQSLSFINGVAANQSGHGAFYTVGSVLPEQSSICVSSNTYHSFGTLYDNFHFIDDPRRRPNSRGFYGKEPYKKFEYEIEIDFGCQDLQNFDIDNYIMTTEGKASMESVTFDFGNMTTKIKGFV